MGGSNFTTPQQVMPSNQCVANQSNFSNGFNPGVVVPYGNFSAMLNAHFLNVANPHPQMQNSHVGRPFSGSGPHNMNSVMTSPQCGNSQNFQQNTSQQGPLFMQNHDRPSSHIQAMMFNPYNHPMNMNQPTGFPQSQFVQIPVNPSQGLTYSAHPCPNPLWGNQQIGFINSSGVASQNAQGLHALNPIPAAQNTSQKNSQGNNTNDYGNDASNIIQQNFHNKKFTRNHQESGRGELPNPRFQKSKFQARENSKGNFKSNKGKGGKGPQNAGPGKSLPDILFPRPNYTEREIQQWREERKKNHPLRSNVEKLYTLSEVSEEAKRRRQVYKFIKKYCIRANLRIAKQAELGVDVAELPFQKKHNKRGKRGKPNRFSKKQKVGNGQGSFAQPDMCREPTPLQKLLSADIKRDMSHLLQVFRFMPLEFPLVTIIGGESKGKISEEKSSPIRDHSNSILQGDEEDEDNNETKEESDTEQCELTVG
ncbi:hypothetical protein MKX01_003469 [Papaver californicum]|nr:hypothetical protein MKX01_003469 [Papaver californicum]